MIGETAHSRDGAQDNRAGAQFAPRASLLPEKRARHSLSSRGIPCNIPTGGIYTSIVVQENENLLGSAKVTGPDR
jgi:hypothetical protein